MTRRRSRRRSARSLPGGDHHAMPEREHRVQHRPDRVGKPTPVHRRRAARRRRGRGRGSAPDPSHIADRPTISPSTTAKCAAQICGSSGERRRRVATSAPNSAEIFGLHEHLGESRMRVVGGRRRQHHLGVGGELDLAGRRPLLVDRHAANLAVVLAGDETSRRGRDRAVAADEFRAILAEDDFVDSGLASAGCAPADQTAPLCVSRRNTKEPQSSHVASSRQRVTAISRQRL